MPGSRLGSAPPVLSLWICRQLARASLSCRSAGMALGLNQVAGIAGQFAGLILGGLLGPVEWHLVFLVSVPFGVFGTFWGLPEPPRAR